MRLPSYPHSASVLCKFKQRGMVSDHYEEVYSNSLRPIPAQEAIFSQVSIRRDLDDDHTEPNEFITITVRIGR